MGAGTGVQLLQEVWAWEAAAREAVRRDDGRAPRPRARAPNNTDDAHLPPRSTNNVEIPGEPTLPQSARTINSNVSGVADVYATSPWRAPGSARLAGERPHSSAVCTLVLLVGSMTTTNSSGAIMIWRVSSSARTR